MPHPLLVLILACACEAMASHNTNELPCLCSFNDSLNIFFSDLARMYMLVSRVSNGLAQLKELFELHVYSQGMASIEKCRDTAQNVLLFIILVFLNYLSFCNRILKYMCLHY